MGGNAGAAIYWLKSTAPAEVKKYLTTLLLATTLFIGEIHTYWEKAPERYENWIIGRYEPMTIQWNVKFVCEEAIGIIYFIAMWFFAKYPNKVNRVTVILFICLAIVDAALYFWNFKTVNFHYVYFCMVAGWIVLLRKELKQRLIG